MEIIQIDSNDLVSVIPVIKAHRIRLENADYRLPQSPDQENSVSFLKMMMEKPSVISYQAVEVEKVVA